MAKFPQKKCCVFLTIQYNYLLVVNHQIISLLYSFLSSYMRKNSCIYFFIRLFVHTNSLKVNMVQKHVHISIT